MIAFPNIDPVAISLGPLDIRWYALSYLCGFLLAWGYALWVVKRIADFRPNKDDIDDFLPWAILGVILGGRLGYTVFYQPDLYMANPIEVFKVWKGGMSFHGGVIGVVVAIVLYARNKKIPLLQLSDIVCGAVPIGLFLGRIANFVNGELFGRAATHDLPWSITFPHGGDIPRHPSQIYEALLEGLLLFCVLFVLVVLKKNRSNPGVITGVFFAGYGAARFFVEYYREPDAHIGLIGAFISMGQILSLPMILFGVGVVVYALRSSQRSAP